MKGPGSAHARRRGFPPLWAGLLAAATIAIVLFFAWSGFNPFSRPFTLKADVYTANAMQSGSPVRIAGIDVGTVTSVDPLPGRVPMSRVTMQINGNGLPLHSDAELAIRSRLLLEGNYFVDLNPGSPAAPKLGSGATLPPTQATGPVQLSQVLTALQSDTRADLQSLLHELGHGLSGGGAEGFRNSVPYWADAYRGSSIVSESSLGTSPHDLSGVVRGQRHTLGALSNEPAVLEGLISNFDVTAGAFARENGALEQTVPALRDTVTAGTPALASLDAALPPLRSFARQALPGVQSSIPTLSASIPFVQQARGLVSQAELRGLVRDLRPTIPALVSLDRESVPMLNESRALSSCQNHVLLPFAETPIPDPDFPANSGQPFYKQAPRTLVGLAGESREADSISTMFRILLLAGPTTVVEPGDGGTQFFGTAAYPPQGVRPAAPAQRPRFRPDVACETQQPPDLNAPGGAADGSVTPHPLPLAQTAPSYRRLAKRANTALAQLEATMRKQAAEFPSLGSGR